MILKYLVVLVLVAHFTSADVNKLQTFASNHQSVPTTQSLAEYALLAQERAQHIKTLMLESPDDALLASDGLHASIRAAGLPVEHPHIEQAFSAVGNVDLLCPCPDLDSMSDGEAHAHFQSEHGSCWHTLWVEEHQRSYRVNFAENHPLRTYTQHVGVPVEGYLLDDVAVIRPSDPKSKLNLGVAHRTETLQACSTNSGTLGAKSLLIILVDFEDKTGISFTKDQVTKVAIDIDTFYQGASFQATKIPTYTITDVLRMPQLASFYITGTNYGVLKADAEKAANAAGVEVCAFDMPVYAFSNIGYQWAGLGSVGGKGTWINGYMSTSKVTGHELGHNYGLPHASFWRSPDGQALSQSGTSSEYGDSFDVMGGGNPQNAHFNIVYKTKLQWVYEATETVKVALTDMDEKGFEVWPFDTVQSRTKTMGVSIPRWNALPAGYEFWLSTRSLFAPKLLGGLMVHIAFKKYRIPGTYLLDLHGETPSLDDSALLPGESWSDCDQGIHITNAKAAPCSTLPALTCVNAVVNRFNTSDGVLKIDVTPKNRFFAINTPLTLSAITDTPGAIISWDMGDGKRVIGSSITFTFPTGTAPAWKTVSTYATDRKGKYTRYSYIVKVGEPTTAAPADPTTGFSFSCKTGRVAGYSPTEISVTPAWVTGSYSMCSATCGGGISTRTVSCMSGGKVEADSVCAGPKPEVLLKCNTFICDTWAWFTGAWSPCSKPCAGGTQTRSIACQVSSSGSTDAVGSKVADALCTATKPATTQACNVPACTSTPLASILVSGPSGSVNPGDVKDITWTSTGTIPRVAIVLWHPNQQFPVYITRDAPNVSPYKWFVNVDHVEGAHFIEVIGLFNDASAASVRGQSPVFSLLDPCKVIGINCEHGKCALGFCKCDAGWVGTACNTPERCAATMCSNHGTCTIDKGCVCDTGYSGANCEIAPSCKLICQNGAPDSGCTTCKCFHDNWKGTLCDTCAITCLNGGQINAGCTKCSCPWGFYGTRCAKKFKRVTLKLKTPVALEKADQRAVMNMLADDVAVALTCKRGENPPEEGETTPSGVNNAAQPTNVEVVWVSYAQGGTTEAFITLELREIETSAPMDLDTTITSFEKSLSTSFIKGETGAIVDTTYFQQNSAPTSSGSSSTSAGVIAGVVVAVIVVLALVVAGFLYVRSKRSAANQAVSNMASV